MGLEAGEPGPGAAEPRLRQLIGDGRQPRRGVRAGGTAVSQRIDRRQRHVGVDVVQRRQERRAVLGLQRAAVHAHRFVAHLEGAVGERAGEQRAALRGSSVSRCRRKDYAPAHLQVRIVEAAFQRGDVHGTGGNQREPGEPAHLREVGVRGI